MLPEQGSIPLGKPGIGTIEHFEHGAERIVRHDAIGDHTPLADMFVNDTDEIIVIRRAAMQSQL